jgi:hypothetical protein
MANFLDDISVYNAKAAAAITLAVTEGNSPKANLMSSLKTTANDTTLSDDIRLEALTALINIGSLLDIPLPPYFPLVTTYADSQTYVGVHNDLSGLNVGDYQHLTQAEKSAILGKASLKDITFANLLGVYTQNDSLVAGFASKQNALNGPGYVKASGGTITYDNSTFLTTTTGILAAATPGGGQITGTYASPVLSNAAVIGKVLTGFNGSASTGTITSSDSILTAMEKLNANVNDVIATSGTINEITFALPGDVFDYTAGPFTSGSAPLSATFLDQNQSAFFAGPSSGGSGQPSFRAIVAGDLPASGATAGSYGSSSTIPVITVDAYGRVTNIANVTSASGGQVNTISYSVPAGVFTSSVTGTSAVSITLGLGTQTANTVWAGPTTGSAAGPTFRSLVSADIPNIAISQVTSLQSALDSKMTYSLNDGEIFIGSIANAPAMKTLSGDVTMTREGVVTIEDGVVTFAKMQDITTQTLLGRWDAATPGVIQEVGLSADFILDNTTGILSLAVPVAPILDTKGSLITYTSATGTQVQLYAGTNGQILIPNNNLDEGLEWVDVTGDVTLDTATPSGAATISAGAVTLAKMANLAANSFIGNNTGSSATPIALTATQATAMLNNFSTSTTTKGLVPGSNGVGNTYYLDATGNWSQPAGGGGGGTTTYALTMNDGGSGAASGTTFNGSVARTISYNTIGAPKYDGTGASGTWGISVSGSAASVANALTIGSGLSGSPATSYNGSAAVTVSLNTGNANSWTALQTFKNNIYLGEAGTVSGSARFLGSTSGYVILQAPAAAGTQTYTLPTAYPGANGYALVSTTGGALSWSAVGTGDVTGPSGATANAIAVFNGTSGKIIKDSGVTFPIGVSNGGIGITSGVSGGIPYFDSTTSIASSTLLAANALVVGGGAGISPSTITTGTGVVTALGVNVGTAGAFVVNGGALGTPASGNFSTGTFTWPTFNQNTTGSAASLTTARNIQTNLASTSAASFNGTADISPGVTGTLPVTNGGTGQTSYTDGQLLIGNSTGNTLTKATLTAGSNITITNAGGSITIAATGGGGSSALSSITAATAGNTINNATFAQEWQWNTLAAGTGFSLTSTSTAAASSTQTLFNIGLSGTNGTSGQSTYAAKISNTHGGTTSTNYALQLTASGGTTINYALDVTAGISRFAAGTATASQLVLTPSSLSGVITGNTNGAMWYDTTSGNSSLYLYKDSSLTKLIVKDRNADFVTSGSGVIVSDANGTLTKSADLTALGIFAQTSTVTVANTTTATTLIGTVTGSATLPANFFAQGKTIIVFITGTYNSTGSPTCTLNLTIGGVAMGTIVLTHNNALTTAYYDAQFVITCRTTGATGTLQYSANGKLNTSTATASAVFFQNSTTSGSVDTTGTLAIGLTGTWSAASPSNSLTASIVTAQYLN